MPHFHATAVFEARGASLEETDQRAATLFKTLRNPRVRYYEHDTSGGFGPYPPSKALYFTVIADFDVEAQSEERATDVVEEVLDAFSPDDIQYLTHGLTPGEQRVNVEQHAPREEQREPERKTRSQRDGHEERKDRRRGSRGRGRNREADRETQVSHEQESRGAPPSRHEEESTITPVQAKVAPPSEEQTETGRTAQPTIEDTVETRELSPSSPAPETVELSQQPPPPRSSSLMRVTLTVKLHASELALPTNEPLSPDHQELAALAIAEARRRHPELPADITPELEVESQQRGDTMLILTWHYDVPVPSAADAA